MNQHSGASPEKSPLWSALQAFEIGSPEDDLTFIRRLARENAWPSDFAARCIDEYKKFLFLATVAAHPVTPSDEVDQVWHLHLTYTRSYWVDLCQNLLGQSLHHEPTRGGGAESVKFHAQYQQTLDTYKAVFGEDPPPDIWPSVSKRFGPQQRFIRINKAQYWCINKGYLSFVWVMALPWVLAACSDLGKSSFPFWFLGCLIVTLVVYWRWRRGGGSGLVAAAGVASDRNR